MLSPLAKRILYILGAAAFIGIFVGFGFAYFGNGAVESRVLHRRRHILKRSPQLLKRGNPFTLKEIVNNEYTAKTWNGTWFSDKEYLFKSGSGDVLLLDVETGVSKIVIPGSIMKGNPRVFKYEISPDLNFALLSFRPQKLYRHSFLATYKIYEIATGVTVELAPSDNLLREIGLDPFGPLPPDQRPPKPLQYATWSPEGHSLAYVFANNVYYRPKPDAEDVPVSISGIPGVIFNGVADWVYEEEVISDTKALYFSPDGSQLAWIEFNDTLVDNMPLNLYGAPSRLEFQYPIETHIRYPKPGRANPFVNVYTSRLFKSSATPPQLMEPPSYFLDKERIIYSVTWASPNEVSLTWENRHQNYSVVSICDTTEAVCSDSLIMTQPNGWMELENAPVFTKSGRKFAMSLPSEGFNHVNIIKRDTNERIPITSGNMEITKIYFWDEVNKKIYFQATRAGYPGERHLYFVSDLTSGRGGVVKCLSCSVANTEGGNCGYNDFEFSKNHKYYTMSCSGPHVPQEYLYQTSPNRLLEILVSNSALSQELSQKSLPKVSNLDVSIAGGKYAAKVRLFLPPTFDENKKYPMLINVYAGPTSQQVSDRFKLDWGTYLTTSEDIIYAIIDGRGSGFKGNDMLFEIYRKLGVPEVIDQIDVTQKLVKQYSFIDKNNVAIWGWSYGGFTTLSALAEDNENVFKCGIAVAPVTNWIYYDTIYAERYMGLPKPNDNLAGYKNSDLSSKAKKLKNKKLLLVHGTADDNVHYQQSMMFTRSLEEADVLFQQLSYPDEAHGIVGLRPHFFHSLTNFILNDCFKRNSLHFD